MPGDLPDRNGGRKARLGGGTARPDRAAVPFPSSGRRVRRRPMTNRLQRIRGAIGMGLTWAAGWAPIGAVTGWVTGAALGFPLGVVTANYAVTFGVLGFIGGTIFSTVLRLAEGGRSFDQLSLPRFVAWGAL